MNFSDTKPIILIVEDVPADIDILNHILSEHYTLHIAKSGKNGLAMAHEIAPDLILLDILLPDITGFAVLEQLKDAEETRNIPVIIITGVNNVQYEEKGLMLGAVDYITKPFHNTVVKARIRTHMQIVKYIQTIELIGLIDALTGLSNRRFFERQMTLEWGQCLRRKTPLGVILLVVDNIGNASPGNGADDQRLQQWLQKTAEILHGSLRGGNDRAARIGQREFAALLPDADQAETEAVAATVLEKIRSLSAFDEKQDSSPSVDMAATAMIPEKDKSCDDLLSKAREILSETLASDRNQGALETGKTENDGAIS